MFLNVFTFTCWCTLFAFSRVSPDVFIFNLLSLLTKIARVKLYDRLAGFSELVDCIPLKKYVKKMSNKNGRRCSDTVRKSLLSVCFLRF